MNDNKDLIDAEHTRVVAPDYATAVRILQERFGSDWTVVHSRKVRRSGLLGWIGFSDVVVIVRTQKSSHDILPLPVVVEPSVNESPVNESPVNNQASVEVPVLAGEMASDEDEVDSTPVDANYGSDFSTEPMASVESDNFENSTRHESHASKHESGIELEQDSMAEENSFISGLEAREMNKTTDNVSKGSILKDLSSRLEGSRQRIADELRDFNSSSPFHRQPDSWQTDSDLKVATDVFDHPSISQINDTVSSYSEEITQTSTTYDDPAFFGRVATFLEKCGIPEHAKNGILSAVISSEVPSNLSPEQLDDLIKSRVGACIYGRIPAPGAIDLGKTKGKTRIIALVGPTGVGKTTTLAKLAAHFHVVEKKRVGLITLDSYRLGAIEQLRRFADIIGLSFKTISEPGKITEEINSFDNHDVVFIDTAGRSQKDVDRITEVRDCLANVEDLEVHLCLSLGASPEALMATADAFRLVGYDKVIFTKKDESYRKGFLWDLFGVMPVPVSYVTCGQEVPEDIEVASREKIRDMILGVE